MITQWSPAETKLDLFARRFRGRKEVWARRFTSRSTGHSGFAPVCANIWRQGLCEKPKQKCALCRNRCFVRPDPDVLLAHLRGQDAAGRPFAAALYPLRTDDSCAFTILHGLAPDMARFLSAIAASLGAPCLAERAGFDAIGTFRLWWFFNEPIPATLARDLVSSILTHAFFADASLHLTLFDQIAPAQSLSPSIGLGLPIPLPLHGGERRHGRTVFVDPDSLQPVPDPWALLSAYTPLPREAAESLVARAAAENRILPVRRTDDASSDFIADAPLCISPDDIQAQRALTPGGLTLRLDNRIRLPLDALSPALRARLVSLAAFVNPDFERNERMRASIVGIPRILSYASPASCALTLPRGCLAAVRELLAAYQLPFHEEDKRETDTPLPSTVRFQGALRPHQKAAADALLPHDTGVLAAGTAFGKTVMAAWLIAQRGVSTLVLVNRRQLQVQWAERLATFLGIPPKEIGRIGGGSHRAATGGIDIAVVQSLRHHHAVNPLVRRYGFVIVDECHGLPAPTFAEVVDQARARYVLGLSATPVRRDGHHPVIALQCGPVRYRIDPKDLSRTEPFTHLAIVRPTAFQLSLALEQASKGTARASFSAICSELIADESRNRLIVGDVREALRAGRSPVVLTDRKAHLATLADTLESPPPDSATDSDPNDAPHPVVIRLQGGMGKRALEETRRRLAEIPDTTPRVLVATGPFLGEGFDDARLDTLFLVMPISWRGRIAQYAGRLHRLHEGKREVRIYDYADLLVPTLERMFNRRCEGYEAIGYTLHLPASAVPGWPREVAVPIEPRWHETYAESIRRLCGDGVTAEVASAFVEAARLDIPATAEGCLRARSAAEAFLFLRLQTLPETQGRFQLNATIDLSFGPAATMEVDFLCTDARLVLELDGPTHFGTEADYRRDRLKDRLLQERGYQVLRFLAADATERLPAVLDAIRETLRISGKQIHDSPTAHLMV